LSWEALHGVSVVGGGAFEPTSVRCGGIAGAQRGGGAAERGCRSCESTLSNILANLETQDNETATQWAAMSQEDPNEQEEFVKIIKNPSEILEKVRLSRKKPPPTQRVSRKDPVPIRTVSQFFRFTVFP
jgi:hypothetical protein